MPRRTPFHPRTAPLCESHAWKEWGGYLAVCSFDRHSEREYFAIRHTASLMDLSPLHKYSVTGPDARAFLAWVWARDVTALRPGCVGYGAFCDEAGACLDDGTITCQGEARFRVTTSERWLGWFRRHARGYDVTIDDVTDAVAALALQGPLSRDLLQQVVDVDLGSLGFFRARRARLAGCAVGLSRTGYTGDLGYEIWLSPEDALRVWDALIDAGRPYGVEPVGLDALDVARIEAGFVMQGVDYVSSRSCTVPAQKSTPIEAGLGWTVDVERSPFVGQAALRLELARGSEWRMVGLELDWAELGQLYEDFGLPPHLAPEACRSAVPIYGPDGRLQVGQMTSHTWSPTLKKMIGIGQVRTPHGRVGDRLRVEHTVEYQRLRVTGTVVERPFFDPPRKRARVENG